MIAKIIASIAGQKKTDVGSDYKRRANPVVYAVEIWGDLISTSSYIFNQTYPLYISMKKTEEVTGCDNCPFCKDLPASPFYYCGHPFTSDGNHTDLIYTFPEAESWCPLKDGSITIKLKQG